MLYALRVYNSLCTITTRCAGCWYKIIIIYGETYLNEFLAPETHSRHRGFTLFAFRYDNYNNNTMHVYVYCCTT